MTSSLYLAYFDKITAYKITKKTTLVKAKNKPKKP